MRFVDQLRQARWFSREQLRPEVLRQRRRSRQGITLPRLPHRRTISGSVWAVTMVKDEADILTATLDHLFGQGVDHVIVSDNLSTDQTPRLLRAYAEAQPRLHLATDSEPAYFQAEKMTHLVHAAWRAGADWVIPFDADEFWFAEGRSLKEFFEAATSTRPEVGIVDARFHHMTPREAHPSDLVHAPFLLDSTPTKPGKVAVRAHRLATVSVGNHGASRVGARLAGLHIAHAIYRGPDQVARKVRQGAAAVMLTDPGPNIARHWRSASTLDDDVVADAWAAISAGRPEPRLKYRAFGPMVEVRPLTWPSWDPHHEVPSGIPPRVFQ